MTKTGLGAIIKRFSRTRDAELLDRVARQLEEAAAEIAEWRNCLRWERNTGRPFWYWDRERLNECRKKYVEGTKNATD